MRAVRIILSVVLLVQAAMLAAQSITLPFSRLDILFAGDIMQHQSQLDAARCSDGTYSYSPCYKYIKGDVTSAAIAVANLETTVGKGRYGGYPSFCAPDSLLYAVRDAGFDVLLFANNHCLDRGKKGALYTMQMMDSLGIQHCGVYRDSTDRAKRYPLMLDRNGIRVALLNYTYGTNGIPVPSPLIVNMIDKEVIASDIIKAKKQKADVIICCIHWGDEYVSLPPKSVRDLADWLLMQGVDHIIGGHPHVLQPMEVRNDSRTAGKHAVVYSLGNLISGMYDRRRDGGAMVRLELHRFADITYFHSLSYALTWVARPRRDDVTNFVIYGAGAHPSHLNSVTKGKFQEFLIDSRMLFDKYNKGNVWEYVIE